MTSIKFISQNNDVGIKLKSQGLSSLTIPSEVAKLWMPQKKIILDEEVLGWSHIGVLGDMTLCVLVSLW